MGTWVRIRSDFFPARTWCGFFFLVIPIAIAKGGSCLNCQTMLTLTIFYFYFNASLRPSAPQLQHYATPYQRSPPRNLCSPEHSKTT